MDPKSPLIFLSYAWADNDAPVNVDPAAIGWAKYFDDYVASGLRGRGYPSIRFWRDTEEYSSNQVFERVIAAALEEAELLVAVVSEGFAASKWCQREVAFFRQELARRGIAFDRERVVKVLKDVPPTDIEQQIPELSGRIGFKFYNDSVRPRVPFFDLGSLCDRLAYVKVAGAVADELKRLLDLHTRTDCGTRGIAAEPEPEAVLEGPIVFVARTFPEQAEGYLKIVAELEARRCRVLPDPASSSGLLAPAASRSSMAKELSRARFSVHILGPECGPPLVGDSPGLVASQLAAASDRARADDGFRRFIWLPSDVPSEVLDQCEEIASLRSGITLLASDELVSDPLPAFRDVVLQQLDPRSLVSRPAVVAVIATQGDAKAARVVCKALVAAGAQPRLVLLETCNKSAPPAVLRTAVRACRAALFFWGEAEAEWFWTVFDAIDDGVWLGRQDPLTLRAVLLAEGDCHGKESLIDGAPRVLDSRIEPLKIVVTRFVTWLG